MEDNTTTIALNSEENEQDRKSKVRATMNKWYRGTRSFFADVTRISEDENEEAFGLQELAEDPEEVPMLEEIMAEANSTIRSLQSEASDQKRKLNEYMRRIDELTQGQEHLRTSHMTELTLVKNDADQQRAAHLGQIQKLKAIRDEMTAQFQLTESKAQQLELEKTELETALEHVQSTMTVTPPTGGDIRNARNTNGSEMSTELEFGCTDISYWKQKCVKFQAALKSLRIKYEREMKERRKLYNVVQDLKGNIRVFARCRPLLSHETEKKAEAITSFPDSETISVISPQSNEAKRFRFDQVFQPESNNDEVYAETKSYIRSVIDGYNVTIFAYGQTGSGKTYTMDSVNQNALSDLFRLQNETEKEWKYTTTVSLLEIYNDKLIDLLTDKKKGHPDKLTIRFKENADGKHGITVEGLKEIEVESVGKVQSLMEKGVKNRHIAHTQMNAVSSRSHSILIVRVTGENLATQVKTYGKLNLIDLAGSERVKKSGVKGTAMKEAQGINKSLSALGDVIEALWKKRKHVPYRNSKLTFLLQDSLGKSAKTLMFINVSPADGNYQETITSLKFAQRAKNVELGTSKKNTE